MDKHTDKLLFSTYVENCIESFMTFISISSLPEIQMIPMTLSPSDAHAKGFGSLATHYYDVSTGHHTLKIWEDIYKPQLHADYLVFHELTHVVDTEKYAQRDKMKNVAIKGYTEYHAAQIDFLKVLGAETASEGRVFSLSQRIVTIIKEQTALSFVLAAHEAVLALLTRSDFPRDLEALVTALGMIFNYIGRKSICKMYASDYCEFTCLLNDTIIESNFLGQDVYNALDTMLTGWLSESLIEILGIGYTKIVFGMVDKYNLR